MDSNIVLPVNITTYLHEENGVKIYYPQVTSLDSREVQKKMNDTIVHTVQQLMERQYQEQDTDSFAQMIGTYELKTNERNILSITFTNYAIRDMAAHGLTFMSSLTFNVKTGQKYELADLFKPNSNYVEVLSRIVQRQIVTRQIPVLEPFSGIRPNQDFYVADKALVLYFQQYELSPYYVGLPMFPISVFQLSNIIAEDGPLGVMATNS